MHRPLLFQIVGHGFFRSLDMVCRETLKCSAILPTAIPSSNICLTLVARIAAVSRRRFVPLSRPLSRSVLFISYPLASIDYTILYYIILCLSSLFYYN